MIIDYIKIRIYFFLFDFIKIKYAFNYIMKNKFNEIKKKYIIQSLFKYNKKQCIKF